MTASDATATIKKGNSEPSFDKTAQRPVMQEGNEGAFAAAQIQAVVPVGAKSLADPGAWDMARAISTRISASFGAIVTNCSNAAS